ncbi:MAG TPA: c-type cytochrome [Gallionellaceae bacterium]
MRLLLVPAFVGSLIAIMLCAALLLFVAEARAGSILNEGEEIYRYGRLASGKPIGALREAGVRIEGRGAACINCHRRSGLGSREGFISIPPITGRYLFHPRAASGEDNYLPFVESMRADRVPYSDATLARAIREGLNSADKPFNYLMPHFELNDAEMAALTSYLKSLDQRKLPGVTDTVLHFATVITPDADPVKAHGMLDVLEHFFADKNAFPLGATPRLHSSRKMMFMVNRRWQLHVWRLHGSSATWQAQLEQRFAREPVLAVISGLAGKTWEPVHAFCEHSAVPCLFPNVDAPPADADHDFYSLYLSMGVGMEAELIANRILVSDNDKVSKVMQIYRAGDSGEAGAKALEAALQAHGIALRSHVLPAGKPGHGVARVLRSAAKSDVVVLWLRPADIAALGKAPAKLPEVYMSGLMGGLEQAPLPSGWRMHTGIAYPFALPAERRVSVDFAMGWFSIRHISVVAEQVQADTYLACGLLAETLKHMADTFVPEYLVERVEDGIGHRIVTGYYPRLTLGTGQRFASKGGYIVHFSEPQGSRVSADGDWQVPSFSALNER